MAEGSAAWTTALRSLTLHRGDAPRGWTLVHEVLPEGPATVPGDRHFAPVLENQRLAASLALDAGDLGTAQLWLEAHDRWLRWAGAVLGGADGLLLWARCHHAGGDYSRARHDAEQALRLATNPRQPLTLLAVHRFLGQLDCEARQFDTAHLHLEHALALATACTCPFERALTLLVTAELGVATGQWVEARAQADEALAICKVLHAQPALRRAEALAETLARPPAVPRRAVSARTSMGLTVRETEVLRLVAAGCTDRDIAEVLSLSIRTVGNHVTHILTKTNTRNRTEAAAFAHRHGLS